MVLLIIGIIIIYVSIAYGVIKDNMSFTEKVVNSLLLLLGIVVFSYGVDIHLRGFN